MTKREEVIKWIKHMAATCGIEYGEKLVDTIQLIADLTEEVRAWRAAGDNYTGDIRVVLSQWPHVRAIAAARTAVDAWDKEAADGKA